MATKKSTTKKSQRKRATKKTSTKKKAQLSYLGQVKFHAYSIVSNDASNGKKVFLVKNKKYTLPKGARISN